MMTIEITIRRPEEPMDGLQPYTVVSFTVEAHEDIVRKVFAEWDGAGALAAWPELIYGPGPSFIVDLPGGEDKPSAVSTASVMKSRIDGIWELVLANAPVVKLPDIHFDREYHAELG